MRLCQWRFVTASNGDELCVIGEETFSDLVRSEALFDSVTECLDMFLVKDVAGNMFALPFSEMSVFNANPIEYYGSGKELAALCKMYNSVLDLFFNKTFNEICDISNAGITGCEVFIQELRQGCMQFYSDAASRAMSCGLYVEVADFGVSRACIFSEKDAFPLFVMNKTFTKECFRLGREGREMVQVHLADDNLLVKYSHEVPKGFFKKVSPVQTVHSLCKNPVSVVWYPTTLYPGEDVFSPAILSRD